MLGGPNYFAFTADPEDASGEALVSALPGGAARGGDTPPFAPRLWGYLRRCPCKVAQTFLLSQQIVLWLQQPKRGGDVRAGGEGESLEDSWCAQIWCFWSGSFPASLHPTGRLGAAAASVPCPYIPRAAKAAHPTGRLGAADASVPSHECGSYSFALLRKGVSRPILKTDQPRRPDSQHE